MLRIVAGVIVVACGFLLIEFQSPIISPVAFVILFFTCGIGLGNETKSILRAGVVKARIYQSREDAIILRSTSPARFYFYAFMYGLMAIFCLLSGTFTLLALIWQI